MKEAPPSTNAPADSVRFPFCHNEDYHPELYEVYWMINETNNRIHTIIEDKTGKLWFGTGGDVCNYDGKTYTSFTKKYGRTFTNFTRNSVGYAYEDRKGNIWTSSRSDNGPD
jgi:ligand-binding sensor domain-containing protein